MKSLRVMAMVVMAGAVLAMVASPAEAGLELTVGGASTVVAYPYGGGDTQTGLGINTSIVAPLHSFTLTTMDNIHSFPFFEIWTDENDMNPSNDETHWAITASLDMSPPPALDIHGGVTFASTDGGAHGVLGWDPVGPVPDDFTTVTTGGWIYTVHLNAATFNQGSGEDFGGTGGSPEGHDGFALVTATVELVQSGGVPPVPEPAGLGLAGMALLALRKRARK